METRERTEQIASSILRQAEEESRRLIEQANLDREEARKQFEEQIISGMFGKMQKETGAIRLERIRRVGAESVAAHRALLLRREELTGRVFSAVADRLREYAHTEEYVKAAADEIRQLTEGPDKSALILYLAADDGGLAQAVQAIPGMKACRVEADASIHIGGWKLLNEAAGVLTDGTLDTKLSDLRPWFLQNCDMKVVE